MADKDPETIYRELNSAQRGALLLIALGQKWSTEVMRLLKEDDVKKISFWVSQLQYVPQEITERVVKEFYGRLLRKTSLASTGGKAYLFDVLSGMMGDTKAKDLIDQIETRDEHEVFRILRQVEPKQLGAYLKQERPQTIALMLAHLEADRSAAIIGVLPEEIQGEVILSLARMEEADPDVVQAMEEALSLSLGGLASGKKMKKVGGPKLVAEVLNQISDEATKLILDQITEGDFELATQIKDLMFVFDDLILLDDKSIQTVIKDVEQNDLILALKGTSNEIKEKMFSNISKRQADTINDELAFMGPVKSSTVNEAQTRIVNIVRKLDEEGKILIAGKGGGGDEIIE